MGLYEDLVNKNTKLAVIGLGYVGLPLAMAFAEKLDVIGYDENCEKINLYQKGIDPTGEVGDELLKASSIEFTCDAQDLRKADFYIVAVPTPINASHIPILMPLERASQVLGNYISKGAVVVYESTVYPGVTEDVCVPILESESGMKCGRDFKVGYSPERINPGDKVHRLNNIVKVVSGMDADTLDIVAHVYQLVALAGIYRAPSIRVAEASKVIENSQRDINIAFMNELSMLFHYMNIDMKEVLKAARTKWNFLDFHPGLVGGHCIGVDPYYLTYKAESIGYYSQLILAGRRINDGMGRYVADCLVKLLIRYDINVKKSKVAVLGIAFKENCPDTRNSKALELCDELSEYGMDLLVVDPVVDKTAVAKNHGYHLFDIDDIKDVDVLVITVAHDEFISVDANRIFSMYHPDNKIKILMDVKGIYDKAKFVSLGFAYWNL